MNKIKQYQRLTLIVTPKCFTWQQQGKHSPDCCFNVDNIPKSTALTNFSVEIKPLTPVGILSGHESWLLYNDPAVRVCFDCQMFSTIPFYACPEHLDWQAEDRTWIHLCIHMLSAKACAAEELILFSTTGRVYLCFAITSQQLEGCLMCQPALLAFCISAGSLLLRCWPGLGC